MQKLLNLINDSTSGNTHANMAGRVSFFNGNVFFNVNVSKSICGIPTSLSRTHYLGWINDKLPSSGANQNLTTSNHCHDQCWLIISNLNIIVGHPNGTVDHHLVTLGDLRLSNNVILHDVLVVHGYCVSLLSVNKLIKDSKLFVGFDEYKCYIQDLDKGITLGTGSESWGLYLFDDSKNISLGNVNIVMAFNVFLKNLYWHNQHLAKQTREPFPLSDHKSVNLGELVHLDLWGPYKVSSREGFSPNDDERATPCEEGGVHSNTDAAPMQHPEENSATQTHLVWLLRMHMGVEAMNNEIEALIRNNTWTITDLPIGKKAIDNKWLYKIKYKSTGQVDKFKARALCYKLDVNNAFLYGDLNEDIYMSLPLGFECADKNKHGFVQSKYDYSLYLKHTNEVFVALLVYVDDFIIIGNSLDEIEKLKAYLKSKFMIKDLEVMKYFLGIEVLDNANGICMTQRKYCLELIHEFDLLAAKPVTTPLPENCVLAVDESDSDKFLKNIFEYQKLLGKLIYLTHTGPDISYVVHCLSQHMHAPLQSHLRIALRVIRYLKNSLSTRIQIYKDKNLTLSCFTDSDWAKCLRTRKSVSGFCVFLGRSLVSWKSKKKPMFPDPLLRQNTDIWQVQHVKSSFLLLNILKDQFCRVLKVAVGLLVWAEALVAIDYSGHLSDHRPIIKREFVTDYGSSPLFRVYPIFDGDWIDEPCKVKNEFLMHFWPNDLSPSGPCIDIDSHLFKKLSSEQSGLTWSGIRFDDSLTLSHLFYADDAFFIGKWDRANILTIVLSNEEDFAAANIIGFLLFSTRLLIWCPRWESPSRKRLGMNNCKVSNRLTK
ncbi:ribonuclease H-like domain-containing protein [Tanacetum coccineum]